VSLETPGFFIDRFFPELKKMVRKTKIHRAWKIGPSLKLNVAYYHAFQNQTSGPIIPEDPKTVSAGSSGTASNRTRAEAFTVTGGRRSGFTGEAEK